MGFTEAFIECMQNAGVQGDLQSLGASAEEAAQQVNAVKGVYQSLDDANKAAVDAVTKDFGGGKILTEGGASGADGLVGVIDASVGWDIGTILQYCDYCLEQAAAAGESETAENQTEEEN